MSILSDKSTQGQNLQDIIDSYNNELMRLHRRSAQSEPASDAASAAPAASDDGSRVDGIPAVPARTGAPSAPETSGLSEAEREQWLKDLEDGLEELRKGLIELAKGQKELSDGLREWQEGMQQAIPASAGASPSVMDSGESIAWLKALEAGMEELRRGLTELAKGQKELSDGLSQWREGMNAPANGGRPAYNASAVNDMPAPDVVGPDTASPHMHGIAGIPSEPPINDPIADIVTHPAGHGNLCVTVNAARQAVPIVGASVTVTLPVSDYELLYSFVSTDGSGRSPEIELPVYEDRLSEHIPPTADGTGITPEYRTYRVRVQAAGFRMKDDLIAEIFDGISSTLNVELEPLSGLPGARSDTNGGEGR